MNELQSSVAFSSPSTRTLIFENPPGLYPVNRYQSHLIANAAYIETLEVSAFSGQPFSMLSAIEICCGGGPAAILLKDAGVGFVGASDVQRCSIEQLRNNATLNGLEIDSLRVGAGLTPWQGAVPWIDIVVCNPPCLPGKLVDDRLSDPLKIAMRGAKGGISILVDVMSMVDRILTPHGRLVFLLTSMMDFRSVEQVLNTSHFGRWHISPGMPIAAPYCPSSDPMTAKLLAMRDAGEIFVWLGDDNWLWRLTWVVALTGRAGPGDDVLGDCTRHLDFYPFGYIPTAEDYLRTLEVFRCSPPSNPIPQRDGAP